MELLEPGMLESQKRSPVGQDLACRNLIQQRSQVSHGEHLRVVPKRREKRFHRWYKLGHRSIRIIQHNPLCKPRVVVEEGIKGNQSGVRTSKRRSQLCGRVECAGSDCNMPRVYWRATALRKLCECHLDLDCALSVRATTTLPCKTVDVE